MKKKTNISVDGVQVAAFSVHYRGFGMTFIIKKTKAGHYFENVYHNGKKLFDRYTRTQGKELARFLGLTIEQINNKLFDSTLKYQWKKNQAKRLAA
jgi:hypothetical protein